MKVLVRSEETQEKVRPQQRLVASVTLIQKREKLPPVTAKITGNKYYKTNLRNVGKLQRNTGLKQLTLTYTETTKPYRKLSP